MLTLNVSFTLANQTTRTFVKINIPKFPCNTSRHWIPITQIYCQHTIHIKEHLLLFWVNITITYKLRSMKTSAKFWN